MTDAQRATMQLRTQWGDDLADGLTTLPFHEYAKSQELRPVYSEMFQTKDLITYTDGTHARVDESGIIRDICDVNILLQKEERVAV